MATCILCKNEAVESKTIYTVYARERSDVPFRDEQKKEYFFCSKHSENSWQFAMMVDRGKPSGKLPPVRFSDINEKQIVKVFSENRFEHIRPMVYKYHNVFTEEEIEQALSTDFVSNPNIENAQDKAKREQRKGVLLGPLVSALGGVLLLAFGIVFSQWLFIVAGIIGLVVAPLVIVIGFVINSVLLNRKPGLKTPQALAENFYDDVSQLISLPDNVTRKVTAYRVLAHTTAKRAEANSVERLGTAWNDLWQTMKDAMTKKHQNLLKSDEVRYSTSMPPHQVVISPKNERVAQVDCEIWFFIGNEKKELGWAILRFDNLAIKNGDRWFLMAGEPGKLQVAISPSAKSVDTEVQPSQQESAPIAPSASQPAQNDQQEKGRQVEEGLSQAQYEREQRISQLDKEISSVNQEVDKLNRQMPKLSNWSPIFSLLLIIGGLYTPILGSSENIGLYLLIGGISVITGFGLMIKRNRFYKKNCKPVLDEIEKKKQHLLQLVRESQNLKNARY